MPLSPLDGRYAQKVDALRPIASEQGLMAYRVRVEVLWLFFLEEEGFFAPLSGEVRTALENVMDDFTSAHYGRIKELEAQTNHDVKAVEYFLRDFVPEALWCFIHFGCTSEDINNTAYALMLRDGRTVLDEALLEISNALATRSTQWRDMPMLSRTHGQSATPTTLGKEMAVFAARWHSVRQDMLARAFPGKFSGATGTFSAHVVAYPDYDWAGGSRRFVEEKLRLMWTPLTTQIEPHDTMAGFLLDLVRLSNIGIDLARDMWGYISLGFFAQKVKAGEVGSSAMPHKVNPIDFENAEGNFKLARALAITLATELPVSRWQRDLTDSTLQRNLGSVLGYMHLACGSLLRGMEKSEPAPEVISADLQAHPEVLAEAYQTVLRAHGHADAYEQLKAFTRGQAPTLEVLRSFAAQADIPQDAKERLLQLRPEDYTGLASRLVDFVPKAE